jgi:hypothetical protein
MEIREQFPETLDGEFDKWFKLVLEGAVSTVSPEKDRHGREVSPSRSPAAFTKLYESGGSTSG